MTHAQAVEKHAAERYLLDEMPELERFAFEEHYFDCADCAEEVRMGALLREGVAAGLMAAPAAVGTQATSPSISSAPSPTGSPASVTSASSRWRGALPWAVAAMLALAVGYQSLWVVPGLRQGSLETQALAPVTLRAATRGAEAAITRPENGVITFALDVNGMPAGTRLAYDLRTADNSSVASGTAAAPPPGTPLLLLVPGSALTTPGGYVLSVRAADGTGPAPVDYRFTLTER
jgi:hypothetical protein